MHTQCYTPDYHHVHSHPSFRLKHLHHNTTALCVVMCVALRLCNKLQHTAAVQCTTSDDVVAVMWHLHVIYITLCENREKVGGV